MPGYLPVVLLFPAYLQENIANYSCVQFPEEQPRERADQAALVCAVPEELILGFNSLYWHLVQRKGSVLVSNSKFNLYAHRMACLVQKLNFGLMAFFFLANLQGVKLGRTAATICDPCGFLNDISENLWPVFTSHLNQAVSINPQRINNVRSF